MDETNIKYHCGKVSESVNHLRTEFDIPGLGMASLHLLRDEVSQVLEANQRLPEEERPDFESLDYYFSPLKHVISELENFLTLKGDVTREERMTARIFAEYLYLTMPKRVSEYQGNHDA